MAERPTTNYTFKTLYIFGILFVVLGHNRGGQLDLFYDWFDYYAFHMGLFAFASGYFFRPHWRRANGRELLHETGQRFVHLLLPATVWNLLYGLLTELLHRSIGLTFGDPLNWYTLLAAPVLHNHQYQWNLAAWFVYSLFGIQVLGVLLDWLRVRFGSRRTGGWWLFLLSLAAGMLAIWLCDAGKNTGWMMPLIRVMYLQVFFCMGIFYRTRLEKHDTLPSRYYFCIVMGAELLMITLLAHRPSVSVAFCDLSEDGYFVPYLAGLLGIAFWLRISRLLAPLVAQSRLAMEIADNTYSIMLHHLTGAFCLNSVFALGNRVFGLFPDFDWVPYLGDIYYRYVPNGQTIWLTVYTAAGIAFSLVIARLQRRLLAKLSRPAK